MSSAVDRLLEEFRGTSDRVEQLLQLAEDQLSACLFKTALETTGSILELVPGQVKGRLLKARSLRGLSRYREAAAVCEAVIDSLGDYVPALELLAEIHASQENWILMQAVVNRGLDLESGHAGFRMLQAEALWNRREYQELSDLILRLPSLEVAPPLQAERLAILFMHCQMLPENDTELQSLIRRRPDIMVLRYFHRRLRPEREQSALRLAELDLDSPVYASLPSWGKIRWRQLRGLMLLDLERRDEAREEFAAVIDQWPESPTAMAAWADGMVQLQSWTESRTRLQEWLQERPEESQLYDALFAVLSFQQNNEELEQLLIRCQQMLPEHSRFPLLHSEFLRHHGRRLEAWRMLQETASRQPLIPGIQDVLLEQAAAFEDPEPFLEQIGHLQQEADLGDEEALVAFHGRMWQWLESRGNTEVALEHLRQLLVLRKDIPMLHLAEARLLLQQDEPEDALLILERVTPLSQEEWREKVKLLHDCGETDRALYLLARQRENHWDENESPARVAAGWLDLTRELEGAAAAVAWSETLDPALRKNPEFLAVLIHVLRHEGRFLDVLGLLADHPETDNDFFNRERAICLFNCGRGEEAREILFSEQQNVHDPDGWHWRAQVLHFLGRPQEALGAVEEGLRLSPHHEELLKQRVILLEAMGDPEAVMKAARLALVQQPDDPDLQRQYRLARFFGGDRGLQMSEYQESLRDGTLNPQEFTVVLSALMDGCPEESWKSDPPLYLLELADETLSRFPDADAMHEFRINLLLRLGGHSPAAEKSHSLFDRIRHQLEALGLIKPSAEEQPPIQSSYAERLVAAIAEWEKSIPDSPRLYLWNISRSKTGPEIAASLLNLLRKAHSGELQMEDWEVLDWFILDSKPLSENDYDSVLKGIDELVREGHDFRFLGQLIFFSGVHRKELYQAVQRWLRFNGFSGGVEERAGVQVSPGENHNLLRTRVLVETVDEIVGPGLTVKLFRDYQDDPLLLEIWKIEGKLGPDWMIDRSLDSEYLRFLLQVRLGNARRVIAHFDLLRPELQEVPRILAYAVEAWLELEEPAKACRLLYKVHVNCDSPEWLLEVQVKAQLRAGLQDKAEALVESVKNRPEAGLYLWLRHILALETKNWADAEKFLEECAHLRPVSDDLRGRFCTELIVAGELDHGERIARERLDFSPTLDSRLLVSLIQVAMDRSEYSRALSLLDRLDASDQSIPAVILVRVRALVMLERWREARTITRAALVREDLDAETRLGLAVVMAMMQESDSIVELLQEPWRNHDPDPENWLQGIHGLLSCACLDPAAAMLAVFRERFAEHPALPEIEGVYTEAQAEQADQLILAARMIEPEADPEAVAIRALMKKLAGMTSCIRDTAWLPLQGELLKRLYLAGRLEEAEMAWQRIPASVRPLRLQHLGVLTALRRGEIRTALARLEEWVILQPDEPGIDGLRVLLHLRLGETEMAEQAIDLNSPDGSHPEDDLMRAVLQLAAGQPESARKLLRKASRKLHKRQKGKENPGHSPFDAWLQRAIDGLRQVLEEETSETLVQTS